LQLLKDILACHDASVVDYDNKKQDFKQVQYIISVIVDNNDASWLIICLES
jgi:hypothetical protein